ncbi:MAG: hypothetical protein JSR58_03905 [Verrucomicrobia bacterium]|nr:hypothetical protein [Verrucomicrobiota bacterium]
MPVSLITAQQISSYLLTGSTDTIEKKPEEKAVWEAKQKTEAERKHYPFVCVTCYNSQDFSPIAQSYFDEAKSASNPECQAILFRKAREVASQVGALYPSLDSLIADSVLQEALACEKAAQLAINQDKQLAWLVRGAKTITPNPEEITDSILDRLHPPAKYQKGSQLWETAAQIYSRTKKLQDSVSAFEAAARCTQRSFLLLRTGNTAMAESENKRLMKLLKHAMTIYRLIELQEGSCANLSGKMAYLKQWKHNFLPKSDERANKVAKRHIQAAVQFAGEVQLHMDRKGELLLHQATHLHEAANYLTSLDERIRLINEAITLAGDAIKENPHLKSNPLYNPDPLNFSSDITWKWRLELEEYQRQLDALNT